MTNMNMIDPPPKLNRDVCLAMEHGVLEGIRFITSPLIQLGRQYPVAPPPPVFVARIPMRPPSRLLHSAWAAAVYCHEMEQ